MWKGEIMSFDEFHTCLIIAAGFGLCKVLLMLYKDKKGKGNAKEN